MLKCCLVHLPTFFQHRVQNSEQNLNLCLSNEFLLKANISILASPLILVRPVFLTSVASRPFELYCRFSSKNSKTILQNIEGNYETWPMLRISFVFHFFVCSGDDVRSPLGVSSDFHFSPFCPISPFIRDIDVC